MNAIAELDRELLLTLLRRHVQSLPCEAVTAISAAADELVDAEQLPTLMPIADEQAVDPALIVGQVHDRMQQLAGSLTAPAEAMACARAARHLAQAHQALRDQQQP